MAAALPSPDTVYRIHGAQRRQHFRPDPARREAAAGSGVQRGPGTRQDPDQPALGFLAAPLCRPRAAGVAPRCLSCRWPALAGPRNRDHQRPDRKRRAGQMRWRGALMWATELGLIARAFAAPITSAAFGTLPDGREAHLYTLTSRELSVAVTDYGARVVSIVSPDRNGTRADVALGFDRLDGYLGDHSYFGAIVGRYANRIAAGRLSLDGHPYTPATHNGANHLHGGRSGVDHQPLDAQLAAGSTAPRLPQLD